MGTNGDEVIYLDHQASTPPDPRVLERIGPWLGSRHANPHSEHVAGQRAMAAIESARQQIAETLGAALGEIIFTSGATEANNLALRGLAAGREKAHLIVSAIEHKCVLDTARDIARLGAKLDIVPVNRNGVVDLDALQAKLSASTTLVSIMGANNETGVVQPIEEIGRMCSELGVPLHVDAAQSYGRLKYNPASSGISLLSISGHKLYATTGIGALFVSDSVGRLLRPIVTGGGQEKGLRSGTVSPFLAVGLGAAADLAESLRDTESARLQQLRSRFLKVLVETFPRVDVVGQQAPRLPGALSIKLHGVDADRLVGAVQPRLAISTGSACASGELHASYVLRAMGLSEDAAASVVRIGLGRFTTEAEVEEAARIVGRAATQQACE